LTDHHLIVWKLEESFFIFTLYSLCSVASGLQSSISAFSAPCGGLRGYFRSECCTRGRSLAALLSNG